jgi:PIN domain nuclease of toxin-antitoxin system
MNFLLDTHTYLWLRMEPWRLSRAASKAIESAENELFLSIVSLWEMTIKSSKNQLELPSPGIEAVASELSAFEIGLVDLTLEDLVTLERLPHLHKDPFDRLLLAQTIRTGFTLITDDGAISKYGVPVLWQ